MASTPRGVSEKKNVPRTGPFATEIFSFFFGVPKELRRSGAPPWRSPARGTFFISFFLVRGTWKERDTKKNGGGGLEKNAADKKKRR